MNIQKLFTIIATASIILLGTVKPVFAVTPPTFPACSNPQGSVQATYSSGTHGIVGTIQEYKGSDTVYKLSDDTLTQCFCSESGDGIQTNWWKISSLTDSEVQILKNLGWYYVPTGALWGLSDTTYMAQNSTYSCKSGQGGVLGDSTGNVLGLAATGNITTIYALIVLGIASLSFGIFLRKTH